jgi:hypothetical protein
MSDQPTAVSIKAPSLGAILSVLGEEPGLKKGGLEEGASVELAGVPGSLVVKDVSKSSGMDAATVVVTLLTPVAQAVIIEWFKTRLAARRARASAPGEPAPRITVVVGDVHVSSE